MNRIGLVTPLPQGGKVPTSFHNIRPSFNLFPGPSSLITYGSFDWQQGLILTRSSACRTGPSSFLYLHRRPATAWMYCTGSNHFSPRAPFRLRCGFHRCWRWKSTDGIWSCSVKWLFYVFFMAESVLWKRAECHYNDGIDPTGRYERSDVADLSTFFIAMLDCCCGVITTRAFRSSYPESYASERHSFPLAYARDVVIPRSFRSIPRRKKLLVPLAD